MLREIRVQVPLNKSKRFAIFKTDQTMARVTAFNSGGIFGANFGQGNRFVYVEWFQVRFIQPFVQQSQVRLS